jgi:hypothetical protein
MTMTAMVPSPDIHKAHPRRGLDFSTSGWITFESGVTKVIQRANSPKVLQKTDELMISGPEGTEP